MCFVYILENKAGQHYTGSCKDLDTRIKKHNQNSVRSTKNKGPWKIIHQESFDNTTAARKRENEIKRHKDIRYFLSSVNRPLVPIV
ncbi:hypothetical protein BU251_08510 [Candidatus Velamenicoccus archaeovorus]|uniref:GIY-YIG domain-containing protein n=1 Tax=Velamenicoccus archaeovorus TaxID=1930593 RepID=A0A410P6I1_VELA1|nr:hypothetical protein BU251_08510 [Candidatus Velamenicoccus archaeovorus]